MAISFQIQEMIHQDIDGVIFRAVDSVDGSPLAVRRFFLPEAQVERLRGEEGSGEIGKSLFSVWLENLMRLEAPNLRQVLGGGFDEVDGTPYIITNWIEGETLQSARDAGHLNPQDRKVFEAQAQAVIDYLPPGLQGALMLDGDHIMVSRNPSGGLEGSFLISPRHYFGAAGGSPVRVSDREQSLAGLSAYFPKGGAFAPSSLPSDARTESKGAAAATELKSAQGGSSKGLLWVAGLVALFLVGAAIWWVVGTPEPSREGARETVEAPAEAIAEPPPLAEEELLTDADADADADSGPEPVVTPEIEESSLAEAEVAKSEPIATTEPEVVADTAVEPAAEAESNDDEGVTSEVLADEKPSAPLEFDPYDLTGLAEQDGQVVTIAGPVLDVAKTGSGSWWYLDFGGGPKTAYVVFRDKNNFPSLEFSDWELIRGQDVRVTGRFSSKGRGKFGSKSELEITSLNAIEVILPPRVYEVTDWQDLLSEVATGEEVLFEATYKNFLARDGAVYLFFEEGLQVAARFPVGGPLSNRAFSAKMKELEGERVRLSAPVMPGPEGKIEVVFELTRPEQFTAAEGGQ